jgi:hypothetical protein
LLKRLATDNPGFYVAQQANSKIYDLLERENEPLRAPKLLTEMAEDNQTFYKNNQLNPWLTTYIDQVANHARD